MFCAILLHEDIILYLGVFEMAEKKSKRVAITVNEDMSEWLQSESDRMGIQLATCVIVMLNDYRRIKEDNEKMRGLMDVMKSLTDGSNTELSSLIKLGINDSDIRSAQMGFGDLLKGAK